MVALTCAGMNRQASRFVDDDKIVVFEENLEWDRLWPDVDLLQRWLDEINLVTASDNLPWPTGCAVEPNESAPDQLLKARPGIFWKLLRKKLIKARLRVVFGYHKFNRRWVFDLTLPHGWIDARLAGYENALDHSESMSKNKSRNRRQSEDERISHLRVRF